MIEVKTEVPLEILQTTLCGPLLMLDWLMWDNIYNTVNERLLYSDWKPSEYMERPKSRPWYLYAIENLGTIDGDIVIVATVSLDPADENKKLSKHLKYDRMPTGPNLEFV